MSGFQRVPTRAWSPGSATLATADTATIVSLAQVSGATRLLEQDNVLRDPADTDPARLFKFYFTAEISGTSRVWRCTSPDGATWSAPAACTLGAGARSGEDPSIVMDWNTRGLAHRTADGKLVLYCEDKATNTIYGYTSTDGLAWDELPGNPIIPRGATGSWDAFLTGSPCAFYDNGTYFVIYEGIAGVQGATGEESIGVTSALTPQGLVKSAANPVWRPTLDPLLANSIVVDHVVRNEAGTEVYLLVHSGIDAEAQKMWRGLSRNTRPTTWQLGDIAAFGSTIMFGATSANHDLTVDYSSDQGTRVITHPADRSRMMTRALVGALRGGGRAAFIPDTVQHRAGGTFSPKPLLRRIAGAFQRQPVLDDFNREANTTSLSVTTTGETWVQEAADYGIHPNGMAYRTKAGGGEGRALVEAGRTDQRVTAVLGTGTPAGGNAGLAFRAVDVNNHFLATRQTLFVCVAGTYTQLGATYTQVAPGQTIEAIAQGTTITVKVDGTTVVTVTDTRHATGTKAGLRITTPDTTFLDNFLVRSP